MRMMRPLVEGTADSKTAIENNLNLIRQLKVKAMCEADKNMELFNEYTQRYSDMIYSDFLKMKKCSTNPNPKPKK